MYRRRKTRAERRDAVRSLVSRGCVVTALVGLGMLVLGRVMTDTTHWSQYVWWVPAGAYVVWAWVWVGLARWALGGRGRARRRGLLRGVARWGSVIATGYVVFLVWDLGYWAVRDRDPEGLRVVHWNVSSTAVDTEASGARLRELGADVYLISNARWDGARRALRDEVMKDDVMMRSVMRGGSVVVSTLEVLADASVYFGYGEGSDEGWVDGVRPNGDRGWVHMVALRTGPDVDDVFVVWVVDLPSEPVRWRRDTVRRAIDAALGDGVSVRSRIEDSVVTLERLRLADLVMGDFNTPRGSGSLGAFDAVSVSGLLRDAHGVAGWGARGSWSLTHTNGIVDALLSLCSWHIDLALVDASHRVIGYELVDVGGTAHLAQSVVLEHP